MSSFIRTSDHLTVVFDDGETATTYTSQTLYSQVVEAVRKRDWELARRLMIPSTQLKEKIAATNVGDRVKIEGGIVYLDDNPLHNTLTDRMLEMVEDGFDITPMSAFLANMMDNPSFRAVNELYDFLESSDLPITEDGHFIAYKRVRSDFMDQYSGTMDNSIGQVVSMPRNAVDEDKSRTCSAGLHFCSRQYLPSYGSTGGGRVVIVKINPRDVVAIPADYHNAKGRTCRYEVIGELELEDESYSSLPKERLEGSFRPDPETQAKVKREPAVARKLAVECFDPKTNIVKAVYSSATAASMKTGIDGSSITKVCRGKRNTAGGYGWRFVEDLSTNPLKDEDMDDLEIGDDYDDGYGADSMY